MKTEQTPTPAKVPRDACYARDDDGYLCGAPVYHGSYVCTAKGCESQTLKCIALKGDGKQCTYKAIPPNRTCGIDAHKRQEQARFAELSKPATTIKTEISDPDHVVPRTNTHGCTKAISKPKEPSLHHRKSNSNTQTPTAIYPSADNAPQSDTP